MSIKNFKNPWVDEWKRGEKLHPDWLGGVKVLGEGVQNGSVNHTDIKDMNSTTMFDNTYTTHILFGGVNDYNFLNDLGYKTSIDGSIVQGVAMALLVAKVKKEDQLKIIQFLHHTNDDLLTRAEAEREGYLLYSDNKMLGKIDTGSKEKNNPSKLFYYTKSELNEFSVNHGDCEAEILFIDLPSAIWDKKYTPYAKTNFHTYLVVQHKNKRHSFIARFDWGFTNREADFEGAPTLQSKFVYEDFQVLKNNLRALREF
jgi:hypothetical protein